jgi:PIN domain nuclease of toxin-antitoxin system
LIVLDTHAWIWLASEPNRLGNALAAARSGKGQAEDAAVFVVSAISAWEVATKVAQGKLELDRPTTEWISATGQEHPVRFEPVSMPMAVRAGGLGLEGFHGDPADRMIVATALLLRCPLATIDEKIREWASTRTDLVIVW